MQKTPDLPIPSDEVAKHSAFLEQCIMDEIKAKGPIPFARFMELALYAPGYGYYVGGKEKLGSKGDFVTAPEISSLFSICIARQCVQVLKGLNSGVILELGAGTAALCIALLQELERADALPEYYYILDVSPDLKIKQKERIAEQIPHLLHKIVWLDCLPQPLTGVIIANEVIDAFPVHRFQSTTDGIKEFYININQERFCWELKNPCDSLQEGLEMIDVHFPLRYESEYNFLIQGFIKSLSETLERGALLLFDYGFPRNEYYHPDRSMGTLMCHYQHRAHGNPLILLGLQDITAHVDFTCIAQAAQNCNLDIAGFTHQASFLLSCGILDILQVQSAQDKFRLANQVKILTSPNEMGELFKAMALTKNLDSPLLGFSMCDLRMKL